MNMCKVMHIITGLSVGGAQRALSNLITNGSTGWPRSVVVSLRDEGAYGKWFREAGVTVYSLDMRRGVPGLLASKQLGRVVYKEQPEVIQGWMYHGNLAASLAAWLAPYQPNVAWSIRHSLYNLTDEKILTQQVIRLNRWLSGKVNSIIYNSRISKEQHEAFGFSEQASRVIPNGFNLDELARNRKRSTAIREQLGVSEQELVIGHVARYHPMKAHASFLRAAVQVARVIPEARFLLVGRGVSMEVPALASIVPQDLSARFIFLGERSDAQTLMQAMDVFCLSSWSEAFPNVLGEAMASGVPCVVTDVGDSADIVGDTGIVVPPSDSEDLAQGLMTMLEKPAEERRALGRAARERIKANYGLKTVVGQYARLYNELAGRGCL